METRIPQRVRLLYSSGVNPLRERRVNAMQSLQALEVIGFLRVEGQTKMKIIFTRIQDNLRYYLKTLHSMAIMAMKSIFLQCCMDFDVSLNARRESD